MSSDFLGLKYELVERIAMFSETNKPVFSPSYRLDNAPWKMTDLRSLLVAELKSILR